jgi:hypothetical protein
MSPGCRGRLIVHYGPCNSERLGQMPRLMRSDTVDPRILRRPRLYGSAVPGRVRTWV